jgi:hypothetical protein
MHVISGGTYGGQENLYDAASREVALQNGFLVKGFGARRGHHHQQQ